MEGVHSCNTEEDGGEQRRARVRGAAAIEPAVLALPLTDAQLRQYDEDGYIVVPGVVEPELCDAIVAQAWHRLDLLFGLKPGTLSPRVRVRVCVRD
jgi:hypothetical protein